MPRTSKKILSERAIAQTLKREKGGDIVEITRIRYVRKGTRLKIVRKGKLYYNYVEPFNNSASFYEEKKTLEGIRDTKEKAIILQDQLFAYICKELDNGRKYDFNGRLDPVKFARIGEFRVRKITSEGVDKHLIVRLESFDENGKEVWVNYSEASEDEAKVESLRKRMENEEGIPEDSMELETA